MVLLRRVSSTQALVYTETVQVKRTIDGPVVACSVTAFRHRNATSTAGCHCLRCTTVLLLCTVVYTQDSLHWPKQQLYLHGLLPGHMLCAATSVSFRSLCTDLLCAMLRQLALTTGEIVSICIASSENATGQALPAYMQYCTSCMQL
jgi:hypothetical protein